MDMIEVGVSDGFEVGFCDEGRVVFFENFGGFVVKVFIECLFVNDFGIVGVFEYGGCYERFERELVIDVNIMSWVVGIVVLWFVECRYIWVCFGFVVLG